MYNITLGIFSYY